MTGSNITFNSNSPNALSFRRLKTPFARPKFLKLHPSKLYEIRHVFNKRHLSPSFEKDPPPKTKQLITPWYRGQDVQQNGVRGEGFTAMLAPWSKLEVAHLSEAFRGFRGPGALWEPTNRNMDHKNFQGDC